ncbi:MAG TPA: recombinase family protein [bacterium]|nr:recombinase family protein [bacterium]
MTGGKSKGVTPKVRCAIYTRKSTEEGLEQEFNTLHAQREAAEAYIVSQKSEGWVVLPDRYDDGGYSGGNMDRPAFKRLMQDIEEGLIDCVVVYKVDRLSRALLDFTKIIETFERQGVTFVSVTQAFNTTTSMGRLTLNILLSFAQFEREIIGERIRDKIAAAKRKGKYTGGMPILGYDVDRPSKKLVVNPEEARLVRHIFKRFVQFGSATILSQELNAQGHTTKSWTTMKGITRPGQPWNKMHLYRLFNNRIYIGEIVHKENRYKGEHEAIVPRELFNKVQVILEENCKVRGNNTRSKTPALLKGLIRCGHCDCSMGPSFTKKDGKTYRYYVCIQATKRGWDSCPVKNVASGEIEGAVMAQLRVMLQSPELVAETYRIARSKEEAELKRLKHERADLELELPGLESPIHEQDIRERMADIDAIVAGLESNPLTEQMVSGALGNLDQVWDELFPAEQSRVVRLLVDKVIVHEDGAEILMRSDGLHSLVDVLDSREERNSVDG